MPWIYTLIGFMIGCGIGSLITRLWLAPKNNERQLSKELESKKYELEQQRQELLDHFAQTSELLDIIGKDYSRLYHHLSRTSSQLLPELPEQDNPFSKSPRKHPSDLSSEPIASIEENNSKATEE